MITYRPYKYSGGGGLANITLNAFGKGAELTEELLKLAKGLNTTSTIGAAIPSSFGNKTGASNYLDAASGALALIPGWGQVAGLALKGVNMLTNAAFGSNVDESAVEGFNTSIANLNSGIQSASSLDLLQSYALSLGGLDIENANLGTQGWFSHKVDDIRDDLLESQLEALGNVSNQALNINIDNIRNMRKSLITANGGPIHIKPSKKGTFTAAATKHGKSVQEFASLVLANKDNYSPAMVKKANFAKNASKWHAFGGDLLTNGSNFDLGYTYIGNGGTHELNPMEGVLYGQDNQGVSNLVELGEYVWNDYVFSNRLKNPKTGNTYAKDFKKISKEYEERPNDFISKNGFNANAATLLQSLEMERYKDLLKLQTRYAAKGGKLGRKFEEGGDTLWDKNDLLQDYYRELSDRFYENWAAELAELAIRKQEILDYDTLLARESDRELDGLYKSATPSLDMLISDYDVPEEETPIEELPKTKAAKNSFLTNLTNPETLRYASVIPGIIGLANPPKAYTIDVPATSYVTAPTVGGKLAYTPLDREYYANQSRADAAATRRAIVNSGLPSALATLLALDFNTLRALGDLYRLGAEYNDKQRQAIAAHNLQVDLINANNALTANKANADIDLLRALLLQKALEYNNDSRLSRYLTTMDNLQNVFGNLSNIALEELNRKNAQDIAAASREAINAKGGKITRRKKGLTY